jgi:hypothetical protein
LHNEELAMKLTVNQVLDAQAALQRMGAVKMPPRAAYWVSRLTAKLHPEWKVAEQKRQELVRKHGEQRDTMIMVPPAKMADYVAEWDPIGNEPIEVEVQPVRLEVFGECALAPADLIALGDLVVDEPAV